MKFDIVVIGASSSGLYAATLLATAGRRVAVFEQDDGLNPARRTYIITPQLKTFLDEIPGNAELSQTRVISVSTPGAAVDIPLKEADWIVERNLLAQGLLEKARSSGIEIFNGYQFLRFDLSAGFTSLVFLSRGLEILVTADHIIGADGFNSHTAWSAGIPLPPTVPIIQAEVQLPPGWDPEVTKVWFDLDDTRFFYWLIPESPTHGVLGLVGDASAQTRQLLDDFLLKQGLQAERYQASQVAMHHPGLQPWGKVGSTPVYLVGDAAGHVKVTTVGGTVSGFWGAQAAATAILEGISYNRALRPLKRELDLHWGIRYLLEALDNPGYDDLVGCIIPSVIRFLSRYNRDQMAGVFWQLPFREPRLLLLGTKIIFTLLTRRFTRWKKSRLEPETGD